MTTTRTDPSDAAASGAPGAWAPLRNRVFLAIWLAVMVSNTGTWVRDVASGWLMTELSPSPLLVSLVQAATTLPVFLLSGFLGLWLIWGILRSGRL